MFMFLFKAEVFVRFIVLKFVEHFLDQTPKELNMMSILKQHREKNIQTPGTLWCLITQGLGYCNMCSMINEKKNTKEDKLSILFKISLHFTLNLNKVI